MEIKMNEISMEVQFITVLIGKGKWQDNNGEIFEINDIKLPTLANGKHVTVYDKDENELENRSYDEGKI